MKDYKTFEELKEELGDKFEKYMYEANIELLEKIREVREYLEIFTSFDECTINGRMLQKAIDILDKENK